MFSTLSNIRDLGFFDFNNANLSPTLENLRLDRQT